MNKKYFILYYISSILTISSLIIMILQNIEAYSFLGFDYDFGFFVSEHILFTLLICINLISFIIITIQLIRKKKFYINKLRFPITYLLFAGFVILIAILFNNKVVAEYMHYVYYLSFILFDYLLLNIYTLFCLKKK